MRRIKQFIFSLGIICILGVCGSLTAYAIPSDGSEGLYKDIERSTEFDYLIEYNDDIYLLGTTQEETSKINQMFYEMIPDKIEGTRSPLDVGIVTEAEYLEIQNKALEITKNCNTDAEKVKAIHDWVADNTYYNYDYFLDGKDDSGVAEPYEVYKTGTAVCSGYARLTFVMLHSVDVWCINVGGVAGTENIEAKPYEINHEWNLVYVNDEWIAIDVTWDSYNTYRNGKKSHAGYHYKYYNASDKVFSNDHRSIEISWVTGVWVDKICYRIANLNLALAASDKSIERAIVLDGVKYLGWGAFKECENLKSIEIPSTVMSIESQAFYNCKNLNDVKLPYGMEEIQSWTFAGCSSLESIDMPYTIRKIGDTAFYNCTALKSVAIPYFVEEIDAWTFAGCSKLENVELPSTIKSLGQYAFGWCYSLDEVIIPKELEECHEDAFSGDNIKIIGFGDLAEEIAKANGFMYTELPEIITYAGLSYNLAENQLISVPDVTSASVPSKVNGITIWSINERALDECNKIQKLRMPKTIIDIEAGTFDNCDNVILSVHEDSFAYQYAIENNILYELIQAIIGDVFCDESVNSKDSIKLSQYLAKWSVDLTSDEMISADIVTDGLINSKDSIKLAQYLAKWNVSLE